MSQVNPISSGMEQGQAASTTPESILLQHEQQIIDAIGRYDMETWQRLVADNWYVVNWLGEVISRPQMLKMFQMHDVDIDRLECRDLQTHIYGAAAIVTGTADLRARFQGQDISGQYRFTDVWIQDGSHWQVVATQQTHIMPQQSTESIYH